MQFGSSYWSLSILPPIRWESQPRLYASKVVYSSKQGVLQQRCAQLVVEVTGDQVQYLSVALPAATPTVSLSPKAEQHTQVHIVLDAVGYFWISWKYQFTQVFVAFDCE